CDALAARGSAQATISITLARSRESVEIVIAVPVHLDFTHDAALRSIMLARASLAMASAQLAFGQADDGSSHLKLALPMDCDNPDR
ncbi:MAG: hypothetical protein OEV65_06290, partial [Aquincola sp.]|nr:hypothetical protein [Aquincola sp.]